jgi:hypothetical protein
MWRTQLLELARQATSIRCGCVDFQRYTIVAISRQSFIILSQIKGLANIRRLARARLTRPEDVRMEIAISTMRDRLDRKQAAEYITARYFPCSKATLDKHAVKLTGPAYSCTGPNGYGPAYYRPEDLDAWCNAQFKVPTNRKKRDWGERKAATA